MLTVQLCLECKTNVNAMCFNCCICHNAVKHAEFRNIIFAKAVISDTHSVFQTYNCYKCANHYLAGIRYRINRHFFCRFGLKCPRGWHCQVQQRRILSKWQNLVSRFWILFECVSGTIAVSAELLQSLTRPVSCRMQSLVAC